MNKLLPLVLMFSILTVITMQTAAAQISLEPQNATNPTAKPDKPDKPEKPTKPEKPQKPQKPKPDKPKKGCQVHKIELKIIGLTPVAEGNQTIIANLQGFSDQEKIIDAGDSSVTFNFIYAKNPEYCPEVGEILSGFIATSESVLEYDVEVTGKNSKKVVDISPLQMEVIPEL